MILRAPSIWPTCLSHASSRCHVPRVSAQRPRQATGSRQWVACSWSESTIRKHRPGSAVKATRGSPGRGVKAMWVKLPGGGHCKTSPIRHRPAK